LPRLVTSVTEYYLQERGGKQFLETFRKHWPKSVELNIYYEGDVLRDDEENIKWHWFEEVEDWPVWEKRISYFPVMNGRIGEKYEVQTDARHWRKAFIEAHGVKRFGGKVFWLDMDVVTFADVPESFLDDLLPDDKICCYLGRKNFYSETGFIGWNGDHPLTAHFFNMYLDFFKSGAIFTQPCWHDCQGFDVVRQMIGRPDLFVDLAGDLPENMHPFINSVAGKYMDHMKGKRKNEGSWTDDLVIERTEDYWKDRKARPSMESTPVILSGTNSPPVESPVESSTQPAG
jgi:hypothetical protein